MNRRLGRERAVQALFSLEGSGATELEPALREFWDSLDDETPGDAHDFAESLVRGAWDIREDLDDAVQAESQAWKVARMARVDRNILRIGAYELLHTDTPARVVINEAIEIAKRYGSEESASFVNGLLDKVARTAGRL